MSETGKTGLNVWNGVIMTEALRELRGKDGYKRYDEMRNNSPVIAALLGAIEQAIRGAEWNYTSTEGPEDERVEFLNRARDNMSTGWADHISEALTMLPFGFSIFEIVYEPVGAEILWRKFAIRLQNSVERWGFDENGGLTGFYQRAIPNYNEVFIPIEKLVLYRTRVEGNNPEGKSVLRPAWSSYYYANNIQQIEGIGIERNLAGLPVITLPEGADPDDTNPKSAASKAAKMVRNVRVDHAGGLVLPFGWVFELASSSGSQSFDTDAVISRYESRMLMAALAQFLMLGLMKVGTQALSEDQTSFFTKSINYVADIIAETHTKYAVKRLLELNGYDTDGISLEHTPVGDIDLSQLADILQKLGNKITWTEDDEVWARDLLQLPEKSVEEIKKAREAARKEQMEMAQAGGAFGGGGGFGNKPGGGANNKRADHSADIPDYLAAKDDRSADDAPPDDAERRKWERRATGVWASFLQGQMGRVIKAAKKSTLAGKRGGK